jgi:hypothetical protein
MSPCLAPVCPDPVLCVRWVVHLQVFLEGVHERLLAAPDEFKGML